MEENNNNEISSNSKKSSSYWKECTCMIIAAFLGGFLAMYFVADQVFDKHPHPKYYPYDRLEKRMLKDFQKMYEREKKAFEHDFDNFETDFFDYSDKKFNKDFNKIFNDENTLNPFMFMNSSFNNIKINTEIDDDKFKVIVKLKAFKENEDNINYSVSGRKLTVFGKSKIKEKNFEQDAAFSHDFILPKNADIANISKKKDGNKLVIEVPLKNRH